MRGCAPARYAVRRREERGSQAEAILFWTRCASIWRSRGRGDDVGNAGLEEVLPGYGFRPRNAEADGVGYAGLAEDSANAKDH